MEQNQSDINLLQISYPLILFTFAPIRAYFGANRGKRMSGAREPDDGGLCPGGGVPQPDGAVVAGGGEEGAAVGQAGLAAYHNPSFGLIGVSTWRTRDGRFAAGLVTGWLRT
jgi:hypothetical protein